MGEISEAVDVASFALQGVGTLAHYGVSMVELGYKIVTALIAFIQQKKKEHLKGEVSVDKLARYEANLSVCRFHDVPVDQIKELLDQYQIPYTVMPEAEINGKKYTQIMFGKGYTERMAAVIQTLQGNGEILDKASIIPYVTEGEVSLDVLANQDGLQQMVCRFPDSTKEQAIEALNAYHIKYAMLPDLNLSDGFFEVAFVTQQQMMVQAMIQRLNIGQIITFEDYEQNADPATVNKMSAEYERLLLKTGDVSIIDSKADRISVAVPKEKIIYEEQDNPSSPRLLIISSAYAVPVPDKDVSESTEHPGKHNITIHAEQKYQKVLPDGSKEEEIAGAEIIRMLQEIAAKHADQKKQTEQQAQIKLSPPPIPIEQPEQLAPQKELKKSEEEKKGQPEQAADVPTQNPYVNPFDRQQEEQMDTPMYEYEDELTIPTQEAEELLRQMREAEQEMGRKKHERSLGR